MDSGHTLEVFHGSVLVFSSAGRWLHPLFELEDYLATAPYRAATLEVHDKIVGRAAALLMVRLGLGRVHTAVLSSLGQEVLAHHGVPHTYDELVDRIACETESLFQDELDPEVAYAELRRRAGRGE
jgi:hypothetical protein